MPRIEEKVVDEMFDVFSVRQLTRSTSLEDSVAVDDVVIGAQQISRIHRHNRSDTVLYIVGGSGEVVVEDRSLEVKAGDRIHIPPGSYHGVRTAKESLHFISVQTPPILNKKTGTLDLEERA